MMCHVLAEVQFFFGLNQENGRGGASPLGGHLSKLFGGGLSYIK
jgi:hypothetical protein